MVLLFFLIQVDTGVVDPLFHQNSLLQQLTVHPGTCTPNSEFTLDPGQCSLYTWIDIPLMQDDIHFTSSLVPLFSPSVIFTLYQS